MIELIPAIDLIDGSCVRLTQGDYAQKSLYATDPLEVAKGYEGIGIRRLHVVDLDGAKASKPQNLRVLERIASSTSLDVQYGGGIKDNQALGSVFDAGASRAICGSIAVTNPELLLDWLDCYGPLRMILGADLRDGAVATHGWLQSSSLTFGQLAERFLPAGLSQAICTDIGRDGMLSGPNTELYLRLQGEFPSLDITVSGGIASLDDLAQLDRLGLRSVIIGKAIYEGRITLKQLEQCLQNGSFPA